MTETNPMTVADIAQQLAAITGQTESYHARQLRAQTRAGVLEPYARGGSGPTAPALYNNASLCRALILYTLTMVGLEMPALEKVIAAMSSLSVDPKSREPNQVERVDGIEWAINRIRTGEAAFLHLEYTAWLSQDGTPRLSGFVSADSNSEQNELSPRLAFIVLPLRELLKPVVLVC
jgi:hypothetical protein